MPNDAESPRPPRRINQSTSNPTIEFLFLALIVVASTWLFRRGLVDAPKLMLDDFAFLLESRTWQGTVRHLWEPHNVHVVPAFRVATATLVSLAGGLERITTWFVWSAWLAIALCAVVAGRIVRAATNSPDLGLLCTTLIALSSTMQPVSAWWSGSQTTWSALAMLLALRAVDRSVRSPRGRGASILMAAFWCVAAPLLWSGGLVAGLVCSTYVARLRSLRGERFRLADAIPLAVSIVLAIGVAAIVAPGRGAFSFDATALGRAIARSVVNTGHGVVEAVLLPSLAIEPRATLLDSVLVLCLVLLVPLGFLTILAYVTRRRPRLSPLGAAAITLIISSYALVYGFRSEMGWEALRGIVWYHAIPQIGCAILLSAGLQFQRTGDESTGAVIHRGVPWWVWTIGLSIVLWANDARAAKRQLIDVPGLSFEALAAMPSNEARLVIASERWREFAQAQARSLGRLARAETAAKMLGATRSDLRQAFGPLVVPGWPPMMDDQDPFDLLAIPEFGAANPAIAPALRAGAGQWIEPLRFDPRARRRD